MPDFAWGNPELERFQAAWRDAPWAHLLISPLRIEQIEGVLGFTPRMHERHLRGRAVQRPRRGLGPRDDPR
eukprot:13744358-Alexandrium_andersonii.AAC.1